MADESQDKKAPAADALVEPRHIMTKKELRLRQYEDINYLIGEDVTKTEIARRMGISLKTLHNIIHEYRGKDLKELHKEAVDYASRKVAHKLGLITEMTMNQTLRMKDRAAGLSILKDTGVLDNVRPSNVKRDDESRITFEFNFAPPPWAPRVVTNGSHKNVQIPEIAQKCTTVDESSTELQAEPPPADVPPRG